MTYVNDPDFTESAIKQMEFERTWSLESNHDYCVDNTTLRKDLTYQYTVDNTTYNVTRNETKTCEYGCDTNTNSCIPDPITRLWWVFVLIGLLALLIFLAWRYS